MIGLGGVGCSGVFAGGLVGLASGVDVTRAGDMKPCMRKIVHDGCCEMSGVAGVASIAHCILHWQKPPDTTCSRCNTSNEFIDVVLHVEVYLAIRLPGSTYSGTPISALPSSLLSWSRSSAAYGTSLRLQSNSSPTPATPPPSPRPYP